MNSDTVLRDTRSAGCAIPDHELLRPIASGSYGEVWLARNAVGTLRAVKIVLGDQHASAESFEREFKGLQKFEPVSRTHDGLVDILTLGLLANGAGFYYVMELADGVAGEVTRLNIPKPETKLEPPHVACYEARTLRFDLKTRGALPADEVIALGLKLTAALAHLHAHGLVHRDVKPSNILFIGGEPKLADAGLVAAMDDARSLVGTAGYIAPEGPGTPQADLYALGKVLYEAAFGKDRQEFPALPADVASRPDHARLLELNAIILKACAADRRERYQSADHVRADLELLRAGRSVKRRQAWQHSLKLARRSVLPGAALALLAATAWLLIPRFNPSTAPPANATPSVPTLAVLPFDEEGAAVPSDLSVRLTEEIRAGLTRVPGLGVIGRGSSEELKQSGQALVLARSNQIGSLLEGRVRRTPDKVLVSLDLTEARSGRLLWSETLESSRADPTAVAIVVVQRVLDPLNVPLGYSQRSALATRPTENFEAQRLYWEARALFRLGTPGLQAALPKLQKAIELDLNFALVYADIAGVNITLAESCPRSGTNYWAPAKAAAERAYALAPNTVDANMAMAGLKETFEYDWTEAERYYRRAVELNPSEGTTHWIFGLFLAKAGRTTEAREHRELALKLDPLEPMNFMNMGHQLIEDEGRPADALAFFERAYALRPYPEIKSYFGKAFLALDRDAEALQAFEEHLLSSDATPESVRELRNAHATSGWPGYWQMRLTQSDRDSSKYHRWHDRAGIYDRLGQTNDVIACLKNSIENREFFATGIRNPNSWKPYRADPRFRELLRMLRVDDQGRPRLD